MVCTLLGAGPVLLVANYLAGAIRNIASPLHLTVFGPRALVLGSAMAIVALVLAVQFTYRAWAGKGRPWVCVLAVAASLPLAFVGAQLLSISTSWRPLNVF